MPTLSVKLSEETKQRMQLLAQNQGTTVHAVMVNAIESALATAEHQTSVISAALRAKEDVLASGTVLDGKAFADYLRARVRGTSTRRPRAIALNSVLSRSR